MDSAGGPGPVIADVIHRLRCDLVSYFAHDELDEQADADAAHRRVRDALDQMPPRLKDEVIIALVSRQAYPLAFGMVQGAKADIEALTNGGTA